MKGTIHPIGTLKPGADPLLLKRLGRTALPEAGSRRRATGRAMLCV